MGFNSGGICAWVGTERFPLKQSIMYICILQLCLAGFPKILFKRPKEVKKAMALSNKITQKTTIKIT